MKPITLLTDFGAEDGYVGVMKGVIYGIAPEAQIADISHNIAAQDVLQGAFVIDRSAPFYPAGTVHVIVVDPGVGTERRPIAARIGEYYYVAPDNGVLTYVIRRAESQGQAVEIVHLDNPDYWLPEISNVFHGRDIFAPAGAHLANGVPLSDLGSPVTDIVRLEPPTVEETGSGPRGQVVLIDNFGNLLTNLERGHLSGIQSPRVHIRDVEIEGLVDTFGERQPGDLVALIGEADDLWVSVVNGSAEEQLGAQVGDRVEVSGE